jgi:amidase
MTRRTNSARPHPAALSLAALARQVAQGRRRARAVLDAHLETLEARNPALNAVVTPCVEQARAAADGVDERIRRGQPVGALAGVPFTVKDVLCTAGVRTTAGHPRHATLVPTHNATVVQRLLDADAILLGKTNTPAFAADIQCNSVLLGRGNHPLDVRRTPGGSSGGGAAAVAAGMSLLDVGSDHGGSLRVPASFCGVVGFKPTWGVVPMAGHLHARPGVEDQMLPLICVGPQARSVADVVAAMAVMTGGAVRPAGPLRHAPVLAWVHQVGPHAADPDTALALRRLHALLGGEERALPLSEWDRTFLAWGRLMALAVWGPLSLGTPGMPLEDARAHQQRMALQLDAWLSVADAVALPTTLGPAFFHTATGSPIRVGAVDVPYWLAGGAATCLASVTGHPAVSVPLWSGADGLPRAVQLVGRRGGDARLLAVASAVEQQVRSAEPEASHARRP